MSSFSFLNLVAIPVSPLSWSLASPAPTSSKLEVTMTMVIGGRDYDRGGDGGMLVEIMIVLIGSSLVEIMVVLIGSR